MLPVHFLFRLLALGNISTVGVKRANVSKSVDFSLLEVFGNESSFSLMCRNVKG